MPFIRPSVISRSEIREDVYDALRRLADNQLQIMRGLSAVTRGETPDSSGKPIADTTKYLFKPGIAGGQIAFGDTNPAGRLVLASTANQVKGLIYFGTNLVSGYDDTNDRLGLGITTPEARAHLLAPVPASIVGITGTAENGWGIYQDDIAFGGTLDGAWLTDDGEHYIAARNSVGSFKARVTLGAISVTSPWYIDYRLRRIGSGFSGIGTYYLFLYRSDGSVLSSPTYPLTDTQVPAAWTRRTEFLYANFQNLSTTPGNANSAGIQYTSGANESAYLAVTWFQVRQSAGPGGRTLSVQMQPSQNEPISEWLDPNAQVLIRVDSGGVLTVGSTFVNPGGIKLIIQGTNTQSVDHMRVQKSDGTIFIAVDSTGKLVLNVAFQFNVGASTGAVLKSNDGVGNASWASAASLATRVQFEWRANGPFQVGTGVDNQLRIPTGFTITSVRLYRVTAGSSGSTIVDLMKNGVTMFTTSGNRPTITAASGNNQSSAGTLPDITSVAAGDVLRMDIIQIEGGTPSDCVLIIEGA